MRSRLRVLLVAAAALLTGVAGLGVMPAAHALQGEPAPPVAVRSAKVWRERHQEFEEYIRTAEIDHFENVPVGVTRPQRAFLKPGGLVASVVWKVLPPGRPGGYWESYKSEIAAYELDKLLGMDMVPVTVEKQWKRQTAAAMLWLSPIRQWKDVEPLPKPPGWNREAIRMKMFDNLIGNTDRNRGNLLVDEAWNLFLIDHSRAFVESRDLPVVMERIDRELWSRMERLDQPTLNSRLGRWLDRSSIRAMLARRDRMAAVIAGLVHDHGEDAVFVR